MATVLLASVNDNRLPSDDEPMGARFVTGDAPAESWAPPHVLAYHDKGGLGWTFGGFSESDMYLDQSTHSLYVWSGDGLVKVGA